MKTLKLKLAITLLSLFAISCSKEDEQTQIPTQSVTLITKYTNDSDPTEYTYDSSYKLNGGSSKVYNWGANGKISQIVDADVVINYTYNSENIIQKIEKKNIVTGYVSFKYEYSYFPTYYEEHRFNSNNIHESTYLYYYSIDGKNIARTLYYYPLGTLKYTYNYTYDTKIGLDQVAPYSQIPMPFYNYNNVTKSTNVNAPSGVVNVIDYTFTYNNENYPISISHYIDAANTILNIKKYEYITK